MKQPRIAHPDHRLQFRLTFGTKEEMVLLYITPSMPKKKDEARTNSPGKTYGGLYLLLLLVPFLSAKYRFFSN